MKRLKVVFYLLFLLGAGCTGGVREYHVAVSGSDSNDGSITKPFQTISAAARIAKAGDIVTVHAGTYREYVVPENGGTDENHRIVYQAAKGEIAAIKGSEIIKTWQPAENGVWKVTIPNAFFGKYNPYQDSIWGDWFTDKGRIHHTGEVYLNGKSFYEVENLDKVMNPKPLKSAVDSIGSTYTWYTESTKESTTIWANFHGSDPNKELVEINARPACFFPEKTGLNYITLRGFKISQAATQWAAPTAEQIGMIGPRWSKGWIIENNVISDSKCSGITLGKEKATGHNVWLADMKKDGAIHYIEVVFRALKIGWSKDNIGSHIIRNNTIFNCEQTGICGSLGAVFSQITNNHIYNIHVKRQFTGAEMAGIKIHASIDMLIKSNRIHNCSLGLWMDWMAQGTRISSNLMYHNNQDLFTEVNHGPILIDNNIMLAPTPLLECSEGVATVHNLFTGNIAHWVDNGRFTPYHLPHSTWVAGLITFFGGDHRFYNNIFATVKPVKISKEPTGLARYNDSKMPVWIASNIYFNGATPYIKEENAIENKAFDPNVTIEEKGEEVFLHINVDDSFRKLKTQLVTSELLGKAIVPNASFENPDGTPLKIDTDYFGNKRSETNPFVGPFEGMKEGQQVIKVW
jgi:hypothetical protein